MVTRLPGERSTRTARDGEAHPAGALADDPEAAAALAGGDQAGGHGDRDLAAVVDAVDLAEIGGRGGERDVALALGHGTAGDGHRHGVAAVDPGVEAGAQPVLAGRRHGRLVGGVPDQAVERADGLGGARAQIERVVDLDAGELAARVALAVAELEADVDQRRGAVVGVEGAVGDGPGDLGALLARMLDQEAAIGRALAGVAVGVGLRRPLLVAGDQQHVLVARAQLDRGLAVLVADPQARGHEVAVLRPAAVAGDVADRQGTRDCRSRRSWCGSPSG